MIFTTLKFLIFFVIVFLLYYILPKKFQWIILLIASLFFYISSSIKYSIFLLLATLITYVGSLLIEKADNERDDFLQKNKKEVSKEFVKEYKDYISKRKRNIVAISIILTLAILIIMKYTNFALENISEICGIFNFEFKSPAWNFILPIGISFYTFMSIGYCIDVYRGEYKPEKNFFKYLAFVSYFPHILQGPIDKYSEVSKEMFAQKDFDYDKTIKGMYRIGIGVFKKMVIADRIAIVLADASIYINTVFGFDVAIAIILYAIQLYSDFSGYMDIAIGCSQMLGIRIAENFDAPYFSKSIAEYWRRWHISLGAWFRDYLYYPLLRGKTATKIRKHFKNKGNKYLSNNLPTVFVLAIFWILIGFWHGSTWGYVAYGMYHGTIIIISTLLAPVYSKFQKKYSKIVKSKGYAIFEIIRTFCLVLVGYFLFWVGSLKSAIILFVNMFRKKDSYLDYMNQFDEKDIGCIIIGTIILFVLDVLTYKKINIYDKYEKLPFFIKWIGYIGMIFVIILFSAGEVQEFLYFKF